MRFLERFELNRQTLRLLWDLFMVWVALINLSLIAFDLSYLWMRPLYLHYVPVVPRVYDRVLGIEPHPITSQLIAQTDSAAQLLELDPGSAQLKPQLDDSAALTRDVLAGNVFDRSGQQRSQIIIGRVIGDELELTTSDLFRLEILEQACRSFWSGSPDLLRHRFALFDQEIRPLLAQNYYREFNIFGRLTNHFWLIDLPFLILFWVEFNTRWVLALRRRTYARWFFFPIFNWYDLLGLIPLQEFRVFRLLRGVSMYMRLRRSKLSSVGRDYLSRIVVYFSTIITEEISDRVALKILEDYEEEIRDGTHLRIVESTFGSRRTEIEAALVEHVRLLLTDERINENMRTILELNLERAIESSDALRSVPLPNAILLPVVRGVGEVILDTTLETVSTTLDSVEGDEAIRQLATSIVDALLESPALEETLVLTEEITIQVIEHMKDAVKVKKWALPDEEKERRRLLVEGEG